MLDFVNILEKSYLKFSVNLIISFIKLNYKSLLLNKYLHLSFIISQYMQKENVQNPLLESLNKLILIQDIIPLKN
jgi:hypothetical protein